MKYFIFLSAIVILGFIQKSGLTGNFQDLLSFKFIDDYPIKIDGGGFYTYDSTSLSRKKYIFIISKDKNAFIQKNNRGFITFYRVKRIVTNDGYSDTYNSFSSDYNLSIDVKKIKTFESGRSEYAGMLNLKKGKLNRTIPIHGIVDDALR